MTKGRLEAFSDGVIAIIITIMVLELRVPHDASWAALRLVQHELSMYVLSFVSLGIYWNNHHHMLHATSRINGAILWANQHLLFWLSLVPFTTRWMGETHLAPLPTAAYGLVLLMAGVAYTILLLAIVRHEGPESKLAAAVGRDFKGKTSVAAYVLAVPMAFVNPLISVGLYVLVAGMWLIPDPRIESRLDR
jgi:uncharacterized membrane protein